MLIEREQCNKKIYSLRFHDIKDWCLWSSFLEGCSEVLWFLSIERLSKVSPRLMEAVDMKISKVDVKYSEEKPWEWRISKACPNCRYISFWLVANPEK